MQQTFSSLFSSSPVAPALVPVHEVAGMRERCRSRFPAAGLDALAGECRQLLVGLAELRDEWRARAEEIDRRRAERERGG